MNEVHGGGGRTSGRKNPATTRMRNGDNIPNPPQTLPMASNLVGKGGATFVSYPRELTPALRVLPLPVRGERRAQSIGKICDRPRPISLRFFPSLRLPYEALDVRIV